MRTLIQTLDRFTEFIGRQVSWLTLVMAAIIFLIVVLRQLKTGSIALQESVVYLHALVLTLGIPYTLRHDGHVRVDVFYGRMRPGARKRVNLIGHCLLLLPLSLFITWISWDYAWRSWQILEGSAEAGGINGVFLLKTCIPLLGVLLTLQTLVQIGHLMRRGAPPSAPPPNTPKS